MSGKQQQQQPQKPQQEPKNPMTRADAARIQAAADRPGPGGDPGFKSRAQAAASHNEPQQHSASGSKR